MASAIFCMTFCLLFRGSTVLLKHGFEVKHIVDILSSAQNAMTLPMQISKCNPLRNSCVSIAKSAGEMAISDFRQRSCTRCRRKPGGNILKPCTWDSQTKIFAQDVLQSRPANTMTGGTCTRAWLTEILHQQSTERRCGRKIWTRYPQSCTSQYLDTEYSHKNCSNRNFGQEILIDDFDNFCR